MSNIAGKAYAMNVLTPMPPWRTWIQTALFMVARVIPQQLSGLLGLKLIHFARWVIIRRNQWPDPAGNGAQTLDNDYMLFLSNFNGTWDQYIDAFADGIPSAGSTCSGTPAPNIRTRSRSVPSRAISAPTRSTPTTTITLRRARRSGISRRRCACGVNCWRSPTSIAAATPAAFAKAYREALTRLANSLASPGYAPIASVATQNADVARREFITRSRSKA